jgi:hypothetical protein
LNALGSLYWFIKVALRRKRLTDALHWQVCRDLEREHLKDLYEMPRDHFKSTICTEGLPMWKALPFTSEDEDGFYLAGYPAEFVRWMRRIHNPDTRILLASENITNAAKLGSRIRGHFESNALYRVLFPETLPDSSCTWSAYSLHVKRTQGADPHGEGTFDFIGVGGALQSRHYPGGIIQDDLVGKNAIESAVTMESTIDYHQLLVGAFEDEDPNHEGDELVVGNRWSFHDLNSHIREHEPWFRVTSHSALGGCCGAHPLGQPIFPQEFSEEKLNRIKARQGTYKFSCQYLNRPVSPEDADFQEAWLRYYVLEEDNLGRKYVVHEVKNGLIIADAYVNNMAVGMMTDPNHSGQTGRARHAIVVVGKHKNKNVYVLDTWAESCNHNKYLDTLYAIARKWKLRKCGFENIAAQKFAVSWIEYRNRYEQWPIRIIPLKGEVSLDDGTVTRNKQWRIRGVIAPIAEAERLCVQRKFVDFIGEYCEFPRGMFVDQLDAFAYVNQVVSDRAIDYEGDAILLAKNAMDAQRVNAPYNVTVH